MYTLSKVYFKSELKETAIAQGRLLTNLDKIWFNYTVSIGKQ